MGPGAMGRRRFRMGWKGSRRHGRRRNAWKGPDENARWVRSQSDDGSHENRTGAFRSAGTTDQYALRSAEEQNGIGHEIGQREWPGYARRPRSTSLQDQS